MAQMRSDRSGGFVAAAATVGAVAAGAALLEVALLPGLAIGAAALLVAGPLERFRRRLLSPDPVNRPRASTAPTPSTGSVPARVLPRLVIGRSLGKTVTFRVIVTGIDFTWNYVIIGEVAAAAGLSAFSLAAGPFFYFLFESGWHYVTGDKPLPAGRSGRMKRTLWKTAAFRLFATTNEFGANFFVVRDLSTAALLTAPGFVIGPFLYLGHEMLWDRFSPLTPPSAV